MVVRLWACHTYMTMFFDLFMYEIIKFCTPCISLRLVEKWLVKYPGISRIPK